MGNLLGSPVTTKETHRGETKAYGDKSPSLKFGLSSMQGWRVHMEDAHIAEGDLYAKLPAPATATSATLSNSNSNLLPIKGHSLFAVYDGHGGTFAAMYAGRNFLRILSKQPKWIEYAQLLKKEEEEEDVSQQKKNENGGMDPKHRELIEAAMRQAFVETDYEIALAIRGSPHPDANEPYHKDAPTHAEGGGGGGDGTDTNNTDASDAPMSTSQDEGDHPDSPSHHHASATMEAASRAAADHVSALDDEGDSGTTACAVLITPTAILCANAGDSRAVYSSKGEAVALSYDHKPDDQPEESRIRAAGGYVAGGRVEGDLAVSRGLGDFRFKEMPTVMRNMDVTGPGGTSSGSDDPAASGGAGEATSSVTSGGGGGDETTMDGDDSAAAASAEQQSSSFKICPPGDQKVSPIPEFIVHPRDNTNDEFVIVACDGIWDVRTNQDCVMEVATMFQEGEKDLGLVSEELLDRCLHLGSKDNMTSIVIQMPGLNLPAADTSKANDNVGVIARRQKREKEAAADEDHHHINMESDDDDDDDDDAMWTQPHGNEELAAVFHEAQQESSGDDDDDDEQ
eukprot:CAMPEP_0113468696 /NCGR_PEP_ID=MMETSP0014_2-20120614/15495_1 /TAXON_ID=2857 /ORGANISM="Nitzschia sp." /LENGTH=568 /DNA_ID=CAMNT_0000361107 /DNA_START=188 /DNA_END=1894 /DNA_ORIENTATION=+ /assembly_acc=CAM_ASM_000159